MGRRLIMFALAVTMLIFMVAFASFGSNGQQLACLACDESGVVDKTPCEAFVVKISFKNTGRNIGTWSVNVAFEGELWTWSGTPQNLTLQPNQKKTLAWNGTVPCDATVGSIARLIVYYNDSFKALNWWIHVVPNAELTITTSTVK
ncbi:MAG: hypothetical protein ACUVUF_03880 [Candidatus Bathycorpusculaceae bacterium]